ncbi:hypothetical protein [Stenotrophomonas sp. Y-13]|uniref:hypothetical protein n=1 Tax=Stenotrophomonas sp. Y-13 TaxID=3384161 RepID=UPI0039170690
MLNKKVLVAAVIGGLFAAGNAAAVDFTVASPATTVNKFAKEIKTTGSASTATLFTGNGVSVKWKSGYAYSDTEVRYVRVEAAPHVLFQAVTPTATGGVGGGTLTPGAVNGVGTNVITFSVTAVGGAVDGSAVLTLPAKVKLLAIADSDIKVSLYDQPSQAQAGGTTGLIAGGSVSGKYFTFADTLKWVGTAETAVANVEANPSFTQFTAATSTSGTAPYVAATLNTGLGIDVTGTTDKDSNVLAVADVLDLTDSSVTISGDFSFVASAGATPFNAAAAGRVTAFGGAAADISATEAEFAIGALADDFEVTKLVGATWNPVIAASEYSAKLNAVSADTTLYNAPSLSGTTVVGAITRNGTELQAPLAQIPGGWYSRLVLTNTSGVARPYTISVMTEEGVTVTTGNLTGEIPANGTKVIDNLDTVFSGHNRATLNVSVAGPNNSIQGLYQLVNPTSGSATNHVLVRPGTN